jgi:hypothetical protein
MREEKYFAHQALNRCLQEKNNVLVNSATKGGFH